MCAFVCVFIFVCLCVIDFDVKRLQKQILIILPWIITQLLIIVKLVDLETLEYPINLVGPVNQFLKDLYAQYPV